MNIEQYIGLLNSLSSAAFTIWGYLLTVSLGIVAFLGTVKSPHLWGTVILCVLFVGVSFSNHKVLERNYKQRMAVIAVIDSRKNEPAFKKEFEENRGIIDSYELNPKRVENGLNFHTGISIAISILIIIWPIFLSRTNKKEGMRNRPRK